MKTETPQTVYLKDYRQPDYWIQDVDLHFSLQEESTRVLSRVRFERNGSGTAPLRLNGEELKLLSVKIDGKPLSVTEYQVTDTHLVLPVVPARFVLEVETEIYPSKNLALEGLYKSGSMFCTQCEAEGFRRITYFLDRPDVMATYKVTIEADKARYPVLLANGNCVRRADLPGGRHLAEWHDPFKKPCYLFALVAGDLGVLEDEFTTCSGRKVKLQIFARHGLQERCKHAMWSLKESMRWDEERFGREYDLDIFMIVAADDFNAGAMENKGLNIFNAAYILADPSTATDTEYDNILAVVGHEYFHNWTGNRITCRDWFQLSLKEGLTVFRDQEFSADLSSREVKRIEDVIRLRTFQFAEDAGTMAHPIRPSSYMAINNFYTLTVYEKGAEVIRMLHTLLGAKGFRQGMDKYFDMFDGQAVTTEDFVRAMELGNHTDFTQFKRWYDQAGTPEVRVRAEYDATAREYHLHVEQHCPPSPGQIEKLPYHIPIALGLLNSQGREMPLQVPDGATSAEDGSVILSLKEHEQTFTFKNVTERPVPSLLRDFSAPVKLIFDYSNEELALLMAQDRNGFVRWEAGQLLATRTIREIVGGRNNTPLLELYLQAVERVLHNKEMNPYFKAWMLSPPEEAYLAQFFQVVEPLAIYDALETVNLSISRRFHSSLQQQYRELVGIDQSEPRRLRNRLLRLLTYQDTKETRALALQAYQGANNMTDALGALNSLNDIESPERSLALQDFYQRWKGDSLVINKWFSLQARATFAGAIERMQRAASDPVFDVNNPNKLYSLYRDFAFFNTPGFHAADGSGYRLLTDCILDVDGRNPQVAARFMMPFNSWRKFDASRQTHMRAQLERILAKSGLSNNVFEIASKALKA